MPIKRLDTEVRLPFDEDALLSKDPLRLTEYIFELIKILQELLADISVATNLTIDLTDGSALYSKSKDATGNYPLGTWRQIQVDDNWEHQVQLTLGVWTTAQRYKKPKT